MTSRIRRWLSGLGLVVFVGLLNVPPTAAIGDVTQPKFVDLARNAQLIVVADVVQAATPADSEHVVYALDGPPST